MAKTSRYRPLALPVLLLAATIPAFTYAAPAREAPAAPAPAPEAVKVDKTPWLYKGSDIAHDPEWRFGTLPNGLRYAVRKNGVPPGQVAIRLHMAVGSMMEEDHERGYAHLLEHLSFRGSSKVPDGESKRVWQRLGVTFGSDSNATTTPLSTTYKLDLPNANSESLDQSMMILADMMAAPNISPTSLTLERPVVLAEQRESLGPGERLDELRRRVLFAGQRFAERPVIGTSETLTASTPESVRAFHQRWYRPERATLVIVGDLDPAIFEAQIVKHFAGWTGVGPNPKNPDFGTPSADHPTSAALVEPSIPPIVLLSVLRPWTLHADTVLFNQERMVDYIAIRIVNRRLERRARAGSSYISAGADLSDLLRSSNATTVQVVPIGEDWETALKEVRAVIADAMATTPTQVEIDREVNEIAASMRNSIDTARVTGGATRADTLIEAIDINEVVTSETTSYSILTGAIEQNMFTPDRVQAATKRLLQGVTTRAIINTRTPDPDVQAKLAKALEADVSGLVEARAAARQVKFDQLPKLGRPSKLVSRSIAVADPQIEQVRFGNGVTGLFFKNEGEVGRIYVNVRFGRGYQALPNNRMTPAWAANIALLAGGIGQLDQEAIDQLTGDRQISMQFSIGSDAFSLTGQTSPADLQDQLRLMATQLEVPGWDPRPITRARALAISSYPARTSSPEAVISTRLEQLLNDGDPRWGQPDLAEIEKLNAADFRALWEPLLATGPIEVQVFGDIDVNKAIEAVRTTFGAMKPRKPGPILSPDVRFPAHVDRPMVLRHSGQRDQAAAVIGWATPAGADNIAEGRKLEILTAVMRDRILDRLRSAEGVSYSPNFINQSPVGQPGGGRILGLTLLPPDKVDLFFKIAREIAADLIAKPIDFDELRRAAVPTLQNVSRRSSGNPFWMMQTEGGTYDPRRLAAVPTIGADYGRITPEDIQALADKYLQPDKDWALVVLPEETPAKAGK